MSDVSNLATVNSSGQIAGESSGALAKLNEDFDSFLTLLTTQLKNQDPTDPVDTAEFTNQLVQFASVEQLIQQSELFKDMLAAQEEAQAIGAVNYIGTYVEVASTRADLLEGNARWSYTLEEEADQVAIQIVDENGAVMNTYNGATTVGSNTVYWDGEKADGTTAPDGRYLIRVNAIDSEGEPIFPTIRSLGIVQGVTMNEGKDPQLVVYEQVYDINQISAVTL